MAKEQETKDKEVKSGEKKDVKPNKGKGKGKPYRKGKGGKKKDYRNPDRDDKSPDSNKQNFVYEDHDNDVAWYKGSSAHSALVEGAANVINFNVIAGQPFQASRSKTNYRVPALLVCRMVTGPGITSVYNTSAVTLAARSMWSAMRQKLTNASRYQPADVAMALMAMDEVYSLASHIHRMFKCVNSYFAQNEHFPNTFLAGLYDFNEEDIRDLRNNRGIYASYYNNMCLEMLKLTIPANYGFVDRHRFLYSGIFGDGHTVKNQYYAFKPYGYRIWEDTASQGSKLKFVTMYSDLYERKRAVYLLETLRSMIDNLTSSESFLEIIADIWKVFGTKSAYAATPTGEFDILQPNFESYNVLSQIENSINVPIAAEDITKGMYDITQDVTANAIIFNPNLDLNDVSNDVQVKMLHGDSKYGRGTWINAHSANPTADDVIEATRMLPAFETTYGSNKASLSSMGFDFIDSFEIWGMDSSDEYSKLLYAYNYVLFQDGIPAMEKLAYLSVFDWSPRFMVYSNAGDKLGVPFQDIDNYAYVDAKQLDMLNYNIQMAAWKVGDITPVVG